MPAKKRLVPPIRPNADGTGFVRSGRPGMPARNRSGGPRRTPLPSSRSDASSSSAASANSRASSVEAAAAPMATAEPRGRQGRPATTENNRPPATATLKSALASPTTAASSASKASSLSVKESYAPNRMNKAVLRTTTALQSSAPIHDFELGVDASLGPSECLLPSRALHQRGMLNGSIVQLTTPYGEVYAEARQMRSAAALDKLLVNEDVAAVLVEKRVRLSPVAAPPQGIPVLKSLTVRPVPPEDSNGATHKSSVSAALAATQEWQAMFRRTLHHKIAYLYLRTTQRVLTQRLTLEVVKLSTLNDITTSHGSSSSSATPTWGAVTDATVLFIENGGANGTAGASYPVAEETKKICATNAVASVPSNTFCTLVVGESGTGKSHWLKQFSLQGTQQLPASGSDSSSTLQTTLKSVEGYHVEWVRVEELPQGEGSEVRTPTALHETFERARRSAPAIILMDDLHLICARETSSAGSRWAMSLIAHALAEELLDLQQRHHNVSVVASAPSLDSLDGCLTGSSLFGQHVVTLEMPAGPAERLACLRACLKEMNSNRNATPAAAPQVVSEECLKEVAECAHGFTQRDLHRLAETAVVKAFHARQSVTPQDADLRAAAAVVRPASLKRFEVSVPNVTWDDIGGSAEAKKTLCDVVEWCLGKQSWIFTEFNLTPPKGVLLYGPPGCSKTMLAKALANESRMNFISVKGPEVFSKWVGDSEKAVRNIFERARAASPCVVFIDELDGMCGHRGRGGVSDRVISQFLTELDGLPAAFEERKNALVFVAATNRPDSIDSAVLRPGRIDRRVYVGLPTYMERVAIAEIQFRHLPVAAELTAAYVGERTEGYTGAEVVAVVKEAAFHAITADATAACVALVDVDAALLKVRPRIQTKDVEWYKQWSHNTQVTTM